MTDSTNDNKDANKGLLKTINHTLKEYFDVRRQRAELKLKHEQKQAKLTTKYQNMDEPLATLEAELAGKLRDLIIPNELVLLGGKLRSFATTFGRVSFKKKPESTKIIDPDGFEKQARKDRLLGKLGKFVRTWKPDAKAVTAWLKVDPTSAVKYEPFLERDGDFDEVFVKPNEPYLTEYDPNQLTAKAVNLGKAEVSQDDTSPDV